jgi:glycosyltransferase involved in cell wall biosynthesis
MGQKTIAISEPVREHLMRDFGVPDERIRVIPHGIDAQRFAPIADADALARIRIRIGLPQNAAVVGTITRLIRARAADQMIESWTQIAQAVSGAWLLIVGEGEDRQRLQAAAQRLPHADRIRFVPSVDFTREALSIMDAFVFLPADKEGFGLVLLEAMAASRAIVSVRRGGGSTWLLEQSGVGRLVEPGDPKALAAAIVPLLQDRGAREALGRHAQDVVRERYTVERMIDAIEKVYQEVIR